MKITHNSIFITLEGPGHQLDNYTLFKFRISDFSSLSYSNENEWLIINANGQLQGMQCSRRELMKLQNHLR